MREPAPNSSAPSLDDLLGDNLPRLVAFIRARMWWQLRTMESASDIAQSVCREFLEGLTSGARLSRAEFRNRLFRAATRKLVDRHRYYTREKRDRRRRHGPAIDAQSVADCYATVLTPSRVASAREHLEQFETAIQQLPEGQRDAILLVKLVGLSTAEVAEIMDRSDSAVRGLVARGLATLVELLDPPS